MRVPVATPFGANHWNGEQVMSDYTPTTDEVRDHYASYPGARFTPETAERFDRWLASVKAEAWDEGWEEGVSWPHGKLQNPYREVSK